MTTFDPFKPGALDIRVDKSPHATDAELRTSLETNGWLQHLPALKDENGRIIIGNRRMEIANELGITPVVDVMHFGDGVLADAIRLQLAVASNLGRRPPTNEERQALAKLLYGQGRTQEQIAETLGVNQSTIARDLQGFMHVHKPHRPKGGRPKGSKKPSKYSPALEQKIASDVLDLGKTRNQAAAEAGVSDIVVRRVVARELGRRDVEPEVTIDDLSVTQRSKAEVFQRRLQRENEVRYQQDVTAGVMERLELILPDYKARLADADKVLNRHKGIFTSSQYRTLLACLHPDGRKAVSDEALTKVRMMIEEYAPVLRQQKEPLQPVPMPKNVVDWMNLKRKPPKTSGKKGVVARR
jgi:transposase